MVQIQLGKTLTFGAYDTHQAMLVRNDVLDYHDRRWRRSIRSMAVIFSEAEVQNFATEAMLCMSRSERRAVWCNISPLQGEQVHEVDAEWFVECEQKPWRQQSI